MSAFIAQLSIYDFIVYPLSQICHSVFSPSFSISRSAVLNNTQVKTPEAQYGKTIFGVYKGVRVGVIRTNGKIATVFPDADQSKAEQKRKRKKK